VNNELMITNEQPSPFKGPPQTQPRQPVQEDTLKSGQVRIERKNFTLMLKENPRGRFLRIIEEVSGRSDSIIIPSTGLAEFQKLLDEMVKASNELPPNKHS
jgi:PurA ssDNA and RNA-binding protein